MDGALFSENRLCTRSLKQAANNIELKQGRRFRSNGCRETSGPRLNSARSISYMAMTVFWLGSPLSTEPRSQPKLCGKDGPDRLPFLRRSAARTIAAPVVTDKDSPSC